MDAWKDEGWRDEWMMDGWRERWVGGWLAG